MKKLLLLANLSIALSFLTTSFFYSPITSIQETHALRKGINRDEPITHPTVSVTDNAAMSAYKGALFSELQVFRERA